MTAKPETAAEVLADINKLIAQNPQHDVSIGGVTTYRGHLIDFRDRIERALSAQGEAVDRAYPHEQMDALAAGRYKIVPTTAGFWPFAVKAGDGEQELYKGHRSTCETVAKRLTGAFLDGGFAAANLIAHPAPARVAEEARARHMDAVKEALSRWPEALPAIHFMSAALGPHDPITADDIAWAAAALES